jgi:hypothetical protein
MISGIDFQINKGRFWDGSDNKKMIHRPVTIGDDTILILTLETYRDSYVC